MDINPKQEIMVNYNRSEPEERGWWYDAVVTQMRCTSRVKRLTVTLKPGTKEIKNITAAI